MTLKEILKRKIYAWFRERSNRAATVKQIQEAFPDYSPDMVEEVLNGRSSKGYYDFRVYSADDGTYCLYTEDFLYPEEAETPKKKEKSEVETKKRPSIKERIENWFKEHGNKPATLKEVQAAFPDVNPKSISGTLSGKDKRGQYNFNACPSDYSTPIRYYSYLPIEEAVKEAVRLATCEGDCSHCEAETCASKGEVENKAKTEKLSIKDRIVNWFRDNGNKPAFLWEVEAAFPDVNPKSISATLSRKDSNGDFDFARVFERKDNKWRASYSLWVEDYAPLASEKPLAEDETRAAEDEEEVETLSPEKMLATEFFTSSKAESSSIAKSLESIAKSLAQIAEAESAIAKRFLKK